MDARIILRPFRMLYTCTYSLGFLATLIDLVSTKRFVHITQEMKYAATRSFPQPVVKVTKSDLVMQPLWSRGGQRRLQYDSQPLLQCIRTSLAKHLCLLPQNFGFEICCQLTWILPTIPLLFVCLELEEGHVTGRSSEGRAKQQVHACGNAIQTCFLAAIINWCMMRLEHISAEKSNDDPLVFGYSTNHATLKRANWTKIV